MKERKKQFVSQVDMKEQTPEILLNAEKPDPLYEKAFLSREDKCSTEYARNTTTED